MPHEITPKDPRLESLIQRYGADERVQAIIRELEIGVPKGGAIDVQKIAKKAHFREKVQKSDLLKIRVELFEIKGHVVFRVQVKRPCVERGDMLHQVLVRGLGSVLQRLEIDIELENEEGPNSKRPKDEDDIWNVWVKDCTLTNANRAYFATLIPKRWNDLIEGLLRR